MAPFCMAREGRINSVCLFLNSRVFINYQIRLFATASADCGRKIAAQNAIFVSCEPVEEYYQSLNFMEQFLDYVMISGQSWFQTCRSLGQALDSGGILIRPFTNVFSIPRKFMFC